MGNEAKMITVKKVIDGKNDDLEVSPEVILISDIRGFRPWRKTEKEEFFVKGDIFELRLSSASGKEAFYAIHINESIKSFSDRLGAGVVIPLITNE